MLNIINNLHPFFEDCYRRIGVREYAKIIKVSPPTASSILHSLEKEGILLKEKDRNYLFFYANKENRQFIDLSRIYWHEKLDKLILYLDKLLINPSLILFGSLSKAEVKGSSDIDIVIIAHKRAMMLINLKNN
jgi:DNA-binding transcriptional regulator YhcF (GntR family)